MTGRDKSGEKRDDLFRKPQNAACVNIALYISVLFALPFFLNLRLRKNSLYTGHIG